MLEAIIAKLVTVPVIGALLQPLINGLLAGYKAKLDAGVSSASISADLKKRELDLDQREAEISGQVLVAEQGNWLTRSIRPLWALPFVVWTWKVVIWDKVLGGWTGGVTDPLTGFAGTLGVTIAGAYFGGRAIEKATTTIAGALKARK